VTTLVTAALLTPSSRAIVGSATVGIAPSSTSSAVPKLIATMAQ
jgi:hypothetical protein